MRKRNHIVWFVSLGGLMLSAGVSAQEMPVAGQSVPGTVQTANVRNSLVSSVSITTQMRSDSQGSAYGSHTMQGYLMGHLALQHFTGRSGLILDYGGGQSVSTGPGGASGLVQALEFSQTSRSRRSAISLSGAISYLPESSFGFGWNAGFSNPSVSGQSVGSAASASIPDAAPPNQTILTARGQRLSGVLRTRLEHNSSPRSSWTASGSYGLLHFDGGGYVDSRDLLLQAGYDYQVSRKDSVSVSYGFDAVRFSHASQGIDEQHLAISFTRRIHSRLNLQVSAGPSLSTFRNPLSGAANELSYRVAGGVNYLTERASLGLSYNRFLTGGSGVLAGAQTSQLQLTAGRVFTRAWQGSMALGYAGNHGFAQTGTSAGQEALRSWYVTTKLSRRLNRGSVFFGYEIRSQNSYGSACAGPSCTPSFVTHQISLGLSWGFRPITL